MRLLVLDNFDSFTYNLVHLVGKVEDVEVDVRLNNEISLEAAGEYDKILLSPGPGLPSEAGIMPAILDRYKSTIPILGVCLGLQAIAESYGNQLKNPKQLYHGVATSVYVKVPDLLFANVPAEFMAGRYHSWVIDEKTLNDELLVTAVDEQGLIMAARHRHHNVCGVQFHPESILSEYGETIIRNWLQA